MPEMRMPLKLWRADVPVRLTPEQHRMAAQHRLTRVQLVERWKRGERGADLVRPRHAKKGVWV